MKLTPKQLDKLREAFRLSPREADVLALLLQGVGSNAELARRLGVSHPTAKLTLRFLYAKTGRATKHEVTILCIDMLHPRF